MPMHNPTHPGEFMRDVYLEPNGITGRQLSAKLDVSPSTLNRVLQGTSDISPEPGQLGRAAKAPPWGRS